MVLEKKVDGKWDMVFCGMVVTDPIIIGDGLNMLDTVENKYYCTSSITNIRLEDMVLCFNTKSGSDYRLINLDFTM